MKNEEIKVKTKTQHLIARIEAGNYVRKPQNEILSLPKLIAKTIILAQNGMLECANNYAAKYGNKVCQECQLLDNESHRLNYCMKFKTVNKYNKSEAEKANFDDVYSREKMKLMNIAKEILSVWNLEKGNDKMKA